MTDIHSTLSCERKIRRRIASYDPDVIVSVHPAMNNVPMIAARKISKVKGKHIPFFTYVEIILWRFCMACCFLTITLILFSRSGTLRWNSVVTDLGSGHCTWFHPTVDKLYLASERMYRLAKRRGRTPDENIVMTGLPIRHDFAVQAEALGDRTSPEGKAYQRQVKETLGLDTERRMILVMGGGEGVGSLSDIVDQLYKELTRTGVDATICVVCGRNAKLQKELSEKDWSSLLDASEPAPKRRRGWFRRFRRGKNVSDPISTETASAPGNVQVVGLGFVTRMAEYMVAADVLVTKAGPGTIAEATAVGLPVMLTSFLPGQEAGNVNFCIDKGFGAYNKDPVEISQIVAAWCRNESILKELSHHSKAAGNPHAAADIVLDIGSTTHSWMALNQAK